MPRIRVMIIDGESASRRRIGRALEGEDDLDLVGASVPGPTALDKVGQLQPDVVVLGLATGEPVGLETLGLLHQARPDLPILVAGPEVVRGGPLTLEALSLGASGCVAYSEGGPPETFRAALVPKVHQVIPRRHAIEPDDQESPIATADPPRPARPASVVDAVVIGSSTGAPNVLAEIFAAMPADFPVPILVAQHIDEHFVGPLAARLARLCPFPVREAVHGESAGPGSAWIGPIGRHLALERKGDALRIALEDGPAENGFRPSVDVLFRTSARALDGRVLGVVLTGMGYDGLRGSRAVVAAGGTVIVQDEATSVCWGMPGSVASAGLASKVLPPSELGPEIVRLARSGRPPRPRA